MGVVRNLFDGLTNALTGAGTTTDPRSYNAYHFRRLSDQEVMQAYRGGWVMRKIIDKPATEMVREWRDWQADKADVALIEKLERSLDLRNKVKRAEILRGLGGAGMVIYNGDANLMQPINPTRVRAGTLKSVIVYHRSRFTLGPMITDPANPWCGHPSFYRLNTTAGQTDMHPSRVAAFRADTVPDMAIGTWDDQWWGDSKVQTVLDAVQNSDTAQNGFAALIKDARNRRLYRPGLTNALATADGERQFTNRVRAMAMGESMFGVTFLDAGSPEDGKGGEKLEDRQMVWAGIPDIAAMYLAAAAGAADMPATVLLGKSPDGMNATGDGDRLIWENTVKARQDLDLRPCLDQLDAVLIPSALGHPDDKIWYKFAPLSTLNEKDEATAFWNTMQAMEIAQGTGTIPPVAFDKGMQNLLVERGWVPGIDAALANVPEGERFPSEMADPSDTEDPSALTEGGDPASQTTRGQPMEAAPLRRAANDAIVTALRDAGVDDATLEAVRAKLGAKT